MTRDIERKPSPGAGFELLSIEVTTRCNISCQHCFLGNGHKTASLPLNVVRSIIAEGCGLGYRHLHVTGGEPLLWDGMFTALDHAFGAGFRTVLINTNGTLLSHSECKKFAQYDGLLISVSLEASEALHNRIRGRGSHALALRGIERAMDAGVPVVVFSTACRSMLQEIPVFADGLYQRYPSLKSLTLIQLRQYSGGGFPLAHELLTPADFVRLVQTVALLNVLGWKTDILNDPLVNVVSTILRMPWVPWARPLIHPGSLMVMADTSIGLCHNSPRRLGEYTPGIMGKILSSETYQREVAPDEATCPSCIHSVICGENGMIRPSPFSADYRQKEPFCREVLAQIAA